MEKWPLSVQERVSFQLRALYDRCGYSRYKMSKFEEYDLYARNKDFLISDRVITFTDVSGKLMALKPDVTLSIVKNSKDDPHTVQKLYYNENVYRVTKGARSFKEIMQVGLECLGRIDDYCICEVLTLAAESLGSISDRCVLEISHLGILSSVMDGIGIPERGKDRLFKLIGEKNLHELEAFCRLCGVEEKSIAMLKRLLGTNGPPETVLPQVKQLISGIPGAEAVDRLLRILSALPSGRIQAMLRFDFSVVDDIHYYNGIVFKGYVQGLPGSVLSGGQYDKLMSKLGRTSGAIGFAVYMDSLERLEESGRQYDVDVLLLYRDAAPETVRSQVSRLIGQGRSVLAQQSVPENVKYKTLMRLRGSEVEILENDA